MAKQFDGYDPYARFDIEEHTIDALELILEKMRQAKERPAAWKWVVVGLHSAMHGGFALVLRRSDGAQLLPKKLEQATYARWERERQTGQFEDEHYDHVDWFTQLYQKTKDPQRMSYLGGSPLEPTDEQEKAVGTLNTYRGSLLHFSATAWSIPTVNFLYLIEELLPMLHFYFFTAQLGTFLHNNHADRARQLLSEIEAERAAILTTLEN